MDGSVQELIDKADKLDVNPEIPEYSTNWCDIPMEMRMECIKRMDFKTRTRLGATSHTEKSLVEAKKYHFNWVRLEHYNRSDRYQRSNVVLNVDALNKSSFGNFRIQTIDNHEKTLNCLVNILKNSEIDTFNISEQTRPNKLLNFWPEIEKCAPFRFKTFKSNGDTSKGTLFFLKNCEGVENILLDNNYVNPIYELSDFINLPAVINAQFLQSNFILGSDLGVHQLVQKWIDNQSEIGKKLRIVTYSAGFLDSFASVFEDRVIYKKDREIHIRTNDDSKHILIRRDKKDRSIYYYSCTIIPSNLLVMKRI